MITTRTGGYSAEEIQILADALTNAHKNLTLDCGGDLSHKYTDPYCIKCENRHVCEDLAMSSIYLATLANMRLGRSNK